MLGGGYFHIFYGTPGTKIIQPKEVEVRHSLSRAAFQKQSLIIVKLILAC